MPGAMSPASVQRRSPVIQNGWVSVAVITAGPPPVRKTSRVKCLSS